jgi:hypothetical protein
MTYVLVHTSWTKQIGVMMMMKVRSNDRAWKGCMLLLLENEERTCLTPYSVTLQPMKYGVEEENERKRKKQKRDLQGKPQQRR